LDSKNWNHPAIQFFQHLNQLTGVMILTAFVSKRKNRELVSAEEESGFYTNTGLVSARVFLST